MFEITDKKILNPTVTKITINAPYVSAKAEAGQFIILRVDNDGERIPLTIADFDREKGTVTIVFQTVGASTQEMAEYEVGESFEDFVGPLGCASELIEMPLEELKKEKILFVCGGVGTAPV